MKEDEILNRRVWFENGKWLADDGQSVFEFPTKADAERFLDRSDSITFFDDAEDEF
jgi:hypothetical protein